jgi:hypothetical protein
MPCVDIRYLGTVYEVIDAGESRSSGTTGSAEREGRFQRWLSLIAASSAVLSGLEVSYEHYKGSYSQPVMYTPVALSGALCIAGVAGFLSRRAAKTVLPAVSALTLADAMIGFGLHVRGIARKPGGWSLPVTNIVMGPPIFAPLLFGVAAYIGLVASTLNRAPGTRDASLPFAAHPNHWAAKLRGSHEPIDARQDARETTYRTHLALATAIAASLSGFEAWYSHYKNNFRYGVQWTPLIVAPMLAITAAAAIPNKSVAHRLLPAAAALAMLNGTIGFGYHLRGTLRRPGGMKTPVYNIIYGPPLLAPLLFSASGFLGVLASLLGSNEL